MSRLAQQLKHHQLTPSRPITVPLTTSIFLLRRFASSQRVLRPHKHLLYQPFNRRISRFERVWKVQILKRMHGVGKSMLQGLSLELLWFKCLIELSSSIDLYSIPRHHARSVTIPDSPTQDIGASPQIS